MVAILLATYNGKKYVKEQIDSILKQKDVLIKIFISDDLSTDGTLEFIRKEYSNNKEIKILESTQKFGSAAKNFFRLIKDVDFSNFDFVAFADQDDIWNDDKLIHSILTLKQKNCDIYSSNVLAFWENGVEAIINVSYPQVKYDFLFESGGPGCTFVLNINFANNFKKHLMNKWQNANKVLVHDWYCYAYARHNSFKWFIDKTVTMHYRQHSSNEIGTDVGLKSFIRSTKRVIKKDTMQEVLKIVNLLEMQNDTFVRKWYSLSRLSMLRLSLYCYMCRRRLKNKILFFFMCIMIAIIKKN
ncbi:MAG: glycosyltransferase [Campylobacteraceae bacterium]